MDEPGLLAARVRTLAVLLREAALMADDMAADAERLGERLRG